MRPGGWLFPGQDPAKPITTRQLSRVVEAAAVAAGLTKHVSPHTLRHSFAPSAAFHVLRTRNLCCSAHLLEDGTDIRVIQVLLGHAKLDNTALYARVATKTVRTVTSPLDKIMGQITLMSQFASNALSPISPANSTPRISGATPTVSCRCPGKRTKRTRLPNASVSARILVVRPPRERPIA